MKFYIFKWFEVIGKLLVYFSVLILTAGLFLVYFKTDDQSGNFAFIASIVYALLLFIIVIPVNKIESFIASKLYEREGYYITLLRLRDAVNSTIRQIDVDNLEDMKNKICFFQIVTGRDDETMKKKLAGKKTQIYVKENGFIYSAKMKLLETEFIEVYRSNNEKQAIKLAMKLNSYYKKSMRKIDKNYERIVKTYGGALQYLVEKDQESSSIEFSVEECKSKIEDIQNDLSDLKYAIEYIDEQIRSNYIDLCNGINERLSNIDTSIEMQSDEIFDRKIEEILKNK